MKIDRIAYFFLGNNVVIGPRVKRRLEFLRGKFLPALSIDRRMIWVVAMGR